MLYSYCGPDSTSMLTVQEAREIYSHKISCKSNTRSYQVSNRPFSMRTEIQHLAKRYGVTARAVQDIWNRQSWAFATSHMWSQESDEHNNNKYSQMSAAEVLKADGVYIHKYIRL